MRDIHKGMIALIVLTAIYGFFGVLNRFIGESFGAFSQQWVRNVFVLIFSCILLFILHTKLRPIKRKDTPWLVIWLLLGAVDMILLFVAFNNLPLGTVYLLFYSTMIVTGIISGRVLFHERLNLPKVVSIFCVLIGIVFIFSFSITTKNIPYTFLALLSGAGIGFWNTLPKKFSENYSELQLIIFDAFASFVVGMIGFLLLKESLPTIVGNSSWYWIVIYAIAQIASIGFLVYGFKKVEAQVGSLILPLEILFASVFGYLIFGETLSMGGIIGGVFIAIGAFLPYVW